MGSASIEKGFLEFKVFSLVLIEPIDSLVYKVWLVEYYSPFSWPA